MSWYVFALVDEPAARAIRGFRAAVSFKKAPGCFAAAERRADIPPLEMGALKAHDRVVAAVWKRVPAILPIRFGTLITQGDLNDALEEREDEIREAFGLVRNTAQFSWRNAGRTAAVLSRAAGASPASGAEYLKRAAHARSGPVPRRYAAVEEALGAFALRERYQPGLAPRPERLYQLVARANTSAYVAAARRVRAHAPLAFTGPWPPYAFVPEML